MPRRAKVPGGPVGVRLNPRQDERCRSAIQTTELLKRLNCFAMEKADERSQGKPVVMSDTQVRAALGLLRKTIPDLAVTTHQGPDGGPVQIVTGVLRGFEAESG